MSILHVCCNLAGSTVFPQLFEALARQGLEQSVFVPEKRAGDLNKNEPRGVRTYRALCVKRSDTLLFFRKAQRSVPVIRREIDMGKAELIHAHTLFTDGSIARRLSRETGVPYMVTLRYSDIEAIWRYEPHLRPMARRILRDARRVVFLGESSRQSVLSGWLRGEARDEVQEKSAVIPNGIDPAWLTGAPRGPLPDPLRVGFAGRLTARKRPLDALTAAHRAGESGRRCVFVAAGEGELEGKLRAQLREGDALWGRVQGMEAMKRFYADCDVLLVPSSAETFGMVYLEAMSQGVPVLYTSGQGFDGQFPEGEVGFSVRCGDIAQQAKRILEIQQGYEARSARCVRHAAQYAWPLVAEKWMTLYAQAVG